MPSKAQQIAAIQSVIEGIAELDDEQVPTSAEFAKRIVEAYHAALSRDLKPLSSPVREGLAFKSPMTGKVHHVAWIEDGLAWIITADSKHGWLTVVGSKAEVRGESFWDYIEETRAKAGAPGGNPKWSVGDKVIGFSTKNVASVIATGDKTVLLRLDPTTAPWSESNEDMEKYYKKVA